MKIEKPVARHDFNGLLSGKAIAVSTKKLKDAAFFTNKEGVDPEQILYQVYLLEPSVIQSGSLNWGLSVLNPVTINGECCMTRGHWHQDRECDEIYVGQSGCGLLMLMDESGTTWCEEVSTGSVHMINGKLAHRLINTGDEPLKVICCWPCRAGHDYAAAEEMPFGCRVYKQADGTIAFHTELQ